MVTVTQLAGVTDTGMFDIGIGEFFNPTPTTLYDGMDLGDFALGTFNVAMIETTWEFGTTTQFGAFTVTDNNLDEGTVPTTIELDGPNGGMGVTGMTKSFDDTITEGLLIAAFQGISNEEGFYKSLFQGNDDFTGGDGDNIMFSYDGRDMIISGDGNDFINSGDGADDVFAGNGNDIVRGRGGSDCLIGGGGKDTLKGGKGKDKIKGGAGKDRIFGEDGADTLTGGSKKDIFFFDADDGLDRIRDWEIGLDMIDLSATGLTFADINIGSYSGGARIDAGATRIRLEGIDRADIEESDFIF